MHSDGSTTGLPSQCCSIFPARDPLDHNRHHEEEIAALAARFEANGQPVAAKKVRIARARMVEVNIALEEALALAETAEPEAPAPEEA